MNILTTHDITNGVFSTVITISSFGSEMLSKEEELNLLNNYSCKLRYKDLDFTGDFKIVDGELKMVNKNTEVSNPEDSGTTEGTGDGENSDITTTSENVESTAHVEIAVSDIAIPINKNFKAEYKIALNKIQDSELGDIFTSKEMVCEAKCILFDNVVKKELARILEEIRNNARSFEGTAEEMI